MLKFNHKNKTKTIKRKTKMPGPESGPPPGPESSLETAGGGGALPPPESTLLSPDDPSDPAGSFELWEQQMMDPDEKFASSGVKGALDGVSDLEPEPRLEGSPGERAIGQAAELVDFFDQQLESAPWPDGALGEGNKVSAWRKNTSEKLERALGTDVGQVLGRTEETIASLESDELIDASDHTIELSAQDRASAKEEELVVLRENAKALEAELHTTPEWQEYSSARAATKELQETQKASEIARQQLEKSIATPEDADTLLTVTLQSESALAGPDEPGSDVVKNALTRITNVLKGTKLPEGATSHIFEEFSGLIEGALRAEAHPNADKMAAKFIAQGLENMGMNDPKEISNVLAKLSTKLAANIGKRLIASGSVPGVDSVKQLLSREQNKERSMAKAEVKARSKAEAKAAKAEAKAAAAEAAAAAKAEAEAAAVAKAEKVKAEMMSDPDSEYSVLQKRGAQRVRSLRKQLKGGIVTEEDIDRVSDSLREQLDKIVKNNISAAEAAAEAEAAAAAKAEAEAAAVAAELLPFSMDGLSGTYPNPLERIANRPAIIAKIAQSLGGQPSRAELEDLFRTAISNNMQGGSSEVTPEAVSETSKMFAEALSQGRGLVPESVQNFLSKMPEGVAFDVVNAALGRSIENDVGTLISEINSRNPDQRKLVGILNKAASVIRLLPLDQQAAAWETVTQGVAEQAGDKKDLGVIHAIENYRYGYNNLTRQKRKALGERAIGKVAKNDRRSGRAERRILTPGAREDLAAQLQEINDSIAETKNVISGFNDSRGLPVVKRSNRLTNRFKKPVRDHKRETSKQMEANNRLLELAAQKRRLEGVLGVNEGVSRDRINTSIARAGGVLSPDQILRLQEED
jgi:hypothetical protein